MGLFDFLKSDVAKKTARYGEAVKNVLRRKVEEKLDESEAKTDPVNPPPSPLERLQDELTFNMNQFRVIQNLSSIEFQPIDYFKIGAWEHPQQFSSLSSSQTEVIGKAYGFLAQCNAELEKLEISKEGEINGNLSKELLEQGEEILQNALKALNL